MKKWLLVAALAAGVWLIAQNTATPKPLAEITPAGPTLYLEAKNFSGLLGDWDASEEKRVWLASDNYQVFARSRLFLRLQQSFEEYSKAMGLPPDMALLRSVAGGESAFALYDISKLEFLFITRLPSARAMDTVLWKAKEQFTARNAAGVAYYVKTAGNPSRTAAFSVVGDLLLLATREEALSGALALLGGANATPVRREAWFDDAARNTAAQGELRMALNMEKLARNPSFRSYWVQGNASEMRDFRAGMNDLVRSAGEIREERVLLRLDPVLAPDTSAVGGLLALAQNASLYRAWAQPAPELVVNLITRKILAPGRGSAPASRVAPGASLEAELVGNEADLESRLDEAPYEAQGFALRTVALEVLMHANRAGGLLQLQSSRQTADRVFVTNDSAVAIQAANNWDAAAVRDAMQQAIEGLYTSGKSGVGWREQQGVWELDGLARIAIATRGRLLIIANNADYLRPLVPLMEKASAQPGATYAAGFRVAGEIPNYTRMMQLIDAPQGGGSGEPMLFSANLASLARSLARTDSFSIAAHDDGRALKQTVVYRLIR